MKKNFAAILASLMIASTLTLASCDSGTVDPKDTKDSSETKSTEVNADETNATEDSKSDKTDTESPDDTDTTEDITDEPTEATAEEPVSAPEIVETEEPIYTPVDDSIKTYFDNLVIPEATQSENKYLRLTDEPITEFVPGSNTGAVFPYVGASGYSSVMYWDEYLSFDLYGLVDSTGTIVCDPKYESVMYDRFEESYLAFYKVGTQDYVSFIDKLGTYCVDVPFDDYSLTNHGMYVFDKKSGTVKFYDCEGNLISETAKLKDDYIKSIFETEEYDEDFYHWEGFYASRTSDNKLINLMNGSLVDLPYDKWEYFWIWNGPANTLVIDYYPKQSSQDNEESDYSTNKRMLYSYENGILYDDDVSKDGFIREIWTELDDYYAVIETDYKKNTKTVKIMDCTGSIVVEKEFSSENDCLGDVWFTEKGLMYRDYEKERIVFVNYLDGDTIYYEDTTAMDNILEQSNDKYFAVSNYSYTRIYVYDYDMNLVCESLGYLNYNVDNNDFYIVDTIYNEIVRASDSVATPIDLYDYVGLISCDGYHMVRFADKDYHTINILYNPEGEEVFSYTALDCDLDGIRDNYNIWY